jgi:ADP-ribosylglycohydrolase
MRIGPLGALYRDNLDLLAKVAWESSLITHATIHAAAFASAVAYVVACFVNGQTVEQIRQTLPSVISEQEKHWFLNEPNWKIGTEDYHFLSGSLREIFENKTLLNPHELRKFISSNSKDFVAEGFTKRHVNQGFVGLGG